MDWTIYLNDIMQVCVIPLLGVLTAFVVVWIKGKTKEIQVKTDNEFLQSCLAVLETTVINAVLATNQTYVEALKKENAFTPEAQEQAFKKTYDAVLASLTEDTKKGLATITTDLTAYITEMIEAKVNERKKEG
jgi:FlaG/FlaF family flagellin (archaellin)